MAFFVFDFFFHSKAVILPLILAKGTLPGILRNTVRAALIKISFVGFNLFFQNIIFSSCLKSVKSAEPPKDLSLSTFMTLFH